MKKTLLALALALATASLPTLLQAEGSAKNAAPSVEASEHEQLAMMRASIRINKRDFIKDAMEFDEKDGKIFWSIYHQYEADLIKLNDIRQDTIEEYAKNYENITEAKADEIVKKSFDYRKARTSLLEKYYGKLAKALSKKTAARFIQVENVLQAAGDVTIGTSIPIMPKVKE
jgi:hypothetical protein